MTLALNPGRIGISVGQMEAIELADEYGFGAVTPDAGYLAGLGDSEMSALKDEMANRDLVFSAAGVPVQFREDRETFRRDLLDLPAHAKTLARAGVSRAGTWIMPTHAERTYHQNFELHARRLRPVARILQDHGIRFGLEYVASPDLYIRDRYPFVHDLAETMDLIGEIGYDNMGLVLDAWHWHFAEDGREALLDLSPEDVVVVDLNDAPDVPIAEQQDTVRRLPTTTGVIDLETFLTALGETGYTGPVRAEPFDDSLGEMGPEKAVARTAETMRAALDLVG